MQARYDMELRGRVRTRFAGMAAIEEERNEMSMQLSRVETLGFFILLKLPNLRQIVSNGRYSFQVSG